MPDKVYITAQQLLEDSFALGMQVLESGFRPDYIVGVWRGGSPVGIAVQELLDFCGVETDHIAVRTSLYSRSNQRGRQVRVHGLNYISKNINHDDGLLIVDDVWDSGMSIRAIIDELNEDCRRNTPENIRVATVFFKPEKNRMDAVPDYFVHETDHWLVFPHELHGLTRSEVEHKPGIGAIARTLLERGGFQD